MLEFLVVNREINIISSASFTTEFTTSGLIKPSFSMSSVKLNALEDGPNDLILMVAQAVMYCIMFSRFTVWIWSRRKMQPLISSIEEHITKETEERKHEKSGVTQRFRSASFNSSRGKTSVNNIHELDTDYDHEIDEESVEQHKKTMMRANHGTKRCCGKRVKCPVLSFTPNVTRHHWTTEETHTPFQQREEDFHGVICRTKPGGFCFCCFKFLMNTMSKLFCCCSVNFKQNVEVINDKLNKPDPDVLPTLLLARCSSNWSCCVCFSHRVLSRGYGSFFTQTVSFELFLTALYVCIGFLHALEYVGEGFTEVTEDSSLMKAVQKNEFDGMIHDQIRYNNMHINLIGLLAVLTMVEWLVWLSKLSRTFSVLFMIIEDMVVRLVQFAVILITISTAFGIFRYVVFGIDIGSHGLFEYVLSPLKEINGERVVDATSLSRQNAILTNLLDTLFIFIMVLLMANLLIAFMADAYSDMMQTGNARYAYNQVRSNGGSGCLMLLSPICTRQITI